MSMPLIIRRKTSTKKCHASCRTFDWRESSNLIVRASMHCNSDAATNIAAALAKTGHLPTRGSMQGLVSTRRGLLAAPPLRLDTAYQASAAPPSRLHLNTPRFVKRAPVPCGDTQQEHDQHADRRHIEVEERASVEQIEISCKQISKRCARLHLTESDLVDCGSAERNADQRGRHRNSSKQQIQSFYDAQTERLARHHRHCKNGSQDGARREERGEPDSSKHPGCL
mmetsp:Transcript_14910/g.24916  ORF Transcript_14910/g.24916 Transcript_14910/m.24916 type:complete len:226 (+) Transcript_14910:382-1059(+)